MCPLHSFYKPSIKHQPPETVCSTGNANPTVSLRDLRFAVSGLTNLLYMHRLWIFLKTDDVWILSQLISILKMLKISLGMPEYNKKPCFMNFCFHCVFITIGLCIIFLTLGCSQTQYRKPQISIFSLFIYDIFKSLISFFHQLIGQIFPFLRETYDFN